MQVVQVDRPEALGVAGVPWHVPPPAGAGFVPFCGGGGIGANQSKFVIP